MSGKPIPEAVVHAFVDWLAKEMPPGTYISSPQWWASRIIRQVEHLTAAQQPAAVDWSTVPDWRVMPFTGSWEACDERWEVYSPDGSGGVVLASDVRSRYVADLLDALATQHQEPKS